MYFSDSPTFDRATAIVDCNPSSRPYRFGEQRWLLWPAWSWRVAVPALPWHELNLFQHYALAMAALGVTRATDIGRRLDLGKELAALILAELTGMGFLQRDGRPSQRGTKYLQDSAREEPELLIGTLFHDPFSGRLWPRFIPEAPRHVGLAAGTYLGRWAKVERGSAGRPGRKRCRVIWPRRDAPRPGPPDARRVLWACRTWARHLQSWQIACGQDRDNLAGPSDALQRFGQGRVTVLSTEPTPVFLTAFLYLPETLRDEESWQVTDPFGMSRSPSLRRQIEEMVADGHGVLEDEIRELCAVGLAVDGQDIREHRRQKHERSRAAAADQLRGLELSTEVEELLLGRLTLMEASREALAQHAADESWRERQRVQDAFIRRSWEACEELFAWLTRTWASPDLGARLSRSAADNVGLLTQLARNLGFVDDEALDELGRLLMVGRGHLVNVLTRDGRHLPAMLAAALLATADDPAHPLHEAARTVPEMVVFLARLKRRRDAAAHHGTTTLIDAVEEVSAWVYRVCHALLPASEKARERQRSPMSAERRGEQSAWTVEHVHRLRARAANRVDHRMGPDIRRHPYARQALIELARTEEELRLLLRAGSDPVTLQGLLADLLIVGGAALESACLLLFGVVPAPNWATAITDSDELHAALRERVTELTGRDDTTDLEPLLGVNLQRVHRAVQSGKAPLSTLVAVIVLATRDHPDHPLRAIASEHGDFLRRVAHIIDTRGHGDTAPAPEAALTFIDEVQTLCAVIAERVF